MAGLGADDTGNPFLGDEELAVQGDVIYTLPTMMSDSG